MGKLGVGNMETSSEVCESEKLNNLLMITELVDGEAEKQRKAI